MLSIQFIIKRLIDLIIALLLLVPAVLFSIVVGILIKMDSKGPALFMQRRLGKNNRIFTMYKFRTMHNDASEKRKELESKNYNPAIIVSNAWFCLVAIENSSDDFVPVSSRKLSESMLMVGKYKGRPVFNLPYLDEPLVLVVDFKKLGSWNQFKPKKEFEEEENLEYFNFFIKAIDKPRAEELIKKDPCFLEDKTTGKGKTKEEAIEELRQRVHLRIVEQFRFDIADPNAGYKILVERDF